MKPFQTLDITHPSPQSKRLTETKILEFETCKLPKIYTPYTYIKCSNKYNEAQQNIINLVRNNEKNEEPSNPLTNNKNNDVQNATKEENKEKSLLKTFQKKAEELIKSTVSFKYIGVNENDNQIGILTKRLPIERIEYDRIREKKIEKIYKLKSDQNSPDCIVDNYLIPHELKTSKTKQKNFLQTTDFLNVFDSLKIENKKQNFVRSYNEKELKKKIKKLNDHKKESTKQSVENKLKVSLEAWENLGNNGRMNSSNLTSYSKFLNQINKDKDVNEIQKAELIKNMKHKIFF